MDLGDGNECSSSSMIIVGNYILGPRIGSGSFAVVWRSRHRHTGAVVAVKEINKKQLSPKVADNLLKEVSILTNIRHPNIIRLIEAIDTEDRIYLVLEYCEGGDLASYIHRHGKVTEAVARHFMRQLAAGLQVLNENHLIHRDLKPQNLLLSTIEATPTLKIGDFGFARYLTPQGLADTLCGSPLYMAPEIIQNKKYDGKADLWSVGAILFQLVTGKPPFDGDSQLQLFQNILTSSELRFPQGSLQELNPDCVALCRALLRHNPVERLTFEELFNHKFLAEPRLTVEVEQSHQILQNKSLVEQFECLPDRKLALALDKRPQLCYGKKASLFLHDNNDKKMLREDHDSTSRTPGVRGVKQHTVCDRPRTSLEGDLNSSDQLRVIDSMESIEKEYVLVNANFASVESFSCSLETSQLNNSGGGFSCPGKKNDWDVATSKREKELASSSTGCTKIPGSNESDPLASSTVWRELQGLSILHPSTRLRLLNYYICALSELAQVKFNAGLLLESFSVELVVLAIWKQAIKVCGSWLTSTTEGDLPGRSESTPAQEGANLPLKSKEAVDFSMPRSVCMWAEEGFLVAFDRAQKVSNHLQDIDGNAQMPDAMEIIFQTALEVGKSGAVDELIGNEGNAAASYSKAMILLSFIVGEAKLLPLSPPFLLTPDDCKRIEGYIRKFESRQSHFKMSQACPKQMVDPFSK